MPLNGTLQTSKAWTLTHSLKHTNANRILSTQFLQLKRIHRRNRSRRRNHSRNRSGIRRDYNKASDKAINKAINKAISME
jgi:hypothetical protein